MSKTDKRTSRRSRYTFRTGSGSETRPSGDGREDLTSAGGGRFPTTAAALGGEVLDGGEVGVGDGEVAVDAGKGKREPGEESREVARYDEGLAGRTDREPVPNSMTASRFNIAGRRAGNWRLVGEYYTLLSSG